jgi:hypothetical protein
MVGDFLMDGISAPLRLFALFAWNLQDGEATFLMDGSTAWPGHLLYLQEICWMGRGDSLMNDISAQLRCFLKLQGICREFAGWGKEVNYHKGLFF